MRGNYDLRKQARYLENEIDFKLIELNKLDSNAAKSKRNDEAKEPLLPEQASMEDAVREAERLIEQLTSLNTNMREVSATLPQSAATSYVLQRHNDILHDYRSEFFKIRDRFDKKMEREKLFRGGSDASRKPSSSGLNRRNELYLKEHEHIRNSDRLMDEQIEIAIDTRETLKNQRDTMKRIQTRMIDFSSRFPVINSLVQKINIRKRRDAIILGTVIGFCTVLLLVYIFQ